MSDQLIDPSTGEILTDGVRVDTMPNGTPRISGTPEAFAVLATTMQQASAQLTARRPSAPPLNRDLDGSDAYPDVTSYFDGRDFIDAPDLADIASDLVIDHDLPHVNNWRIRYLWKAKSSAYDAGKCQMLSGLARYYAGAEFVIWLSAEFCAANQYTRRQVEALLFHELNHVGTKITQAGDMKPEARRHDAEVFRAELEEYGLWRDDLQETFGQLSFDLDGAA